MDLFFPYALILYVERFDIRPPQLPPKALYNKHISLAASYILFTAINIIILIFLLQDNQFTIKGVLLGGWGRNPLWFIPVLICIEILTTVLVSTNKTAKYSAVLFLLSVFIFKVSTNYWLPYCMSEIPWFFLCFIFGYGLKERITGIPAKPHMLAALAIIHLLLLFWIIIPYNHLYRTSDNDLLSYVFRIVIGVIGTVNMYLFAKLLVRFKFSKILIWLGTNTIVIYAMHWPLIKCVNRIGYEWYFYLIPLGASILLIYPFNRIVKPLLSQLKQQPLKLHKI